MRFVPLVIVASLIIAGAIGLLGEEPKMTKEGLTSETKAIKGNDVTVFVKPRKGLAWVFVKIANMGRIKYGEVDVMGIDGAGREIKGLIGVTNETNSETLYTPSNSPADYVFSLGYYRFTLRDGERLEKVKVTRGGESYTFKVVLPVTGQ